MTIVHGLMRETMPFAVADGDAAKVLSLLEQGADINEDYGDDSPLLIQAICLNRFEMAHLLIDNGARPDEKNLAGFTALHLAAISGYTDIVQHLVEKGADISIKDPRGLDALREAEKHHHPETAQVLKDAVKVLAAKESHVTASNRQECLKQHAPRLRILAAKP